MKQFSKYLLLLYTLINLMFFSYNGFEDSFWGSSFIILVNIMPIPILICYLFKNGGLKKGYFTNAVCLFILAMILAAFSASIYYQQSLLSSFKSTNTYYPYFLYLLLVQISYSKEVILQIVKIFFWATLVVFLIDVQTFPNSMFSWRLEERIDRGTLGLFFYGQGFTILGAFYYLSSFLKNRRKLHVIPFLIACVFITLFTGSRTYVVGLIVGTIFMVILYLIKSKTSLKKWIAIISVVLSVSLGLLLIQDELLNIVTITTEQIDNFETDIRSECIQFFVGEFQKNNITKITGNGYPYSDTNLTIAFNNATTQNYYTSDIGIIGIWVHLGIFAVIFWIIFFIKGLNPKLLYQNLYITGFFVYLLVNSGLVYTLFDGGYVLSYIYAMFLYENKLK